MTPTLGDDRGRVIATGSPAVGRVRLLSPAVLVLALLLCILAATALRPAPAFGCQGDGPCESPSALVQCPATPAGSSGSGFATFNIPKDAKGVYYVITDTETGVAYSNTHPLCPGATLSSSATRTSGATEDTYKVSYTVTSTGSSNPSESHEVTITADWSREADLEIIKTLLGGGTTVDAEQEVIFSIVIRNHGPGNANRFEFSDSFQADDEADVTVLKVEQKSGPAPINPIEVDNNDMEAEWDKLKADDEIVLFVHVRADGHGVIGNTGDVKHVLGSKRFEPSPDPHSNVVEKGFLVKPAPDSKIEKAGDGGVSGTAQPPEVMRSPSPGRAASPGIDHVEVAILRTGGGKALKGGLPADQTHKQGSCKWMKNKKGKLGGREPVEGICDSPIWLDAKGTKHWKLELKEDLGKGKYVVYSRAVAEDGTGEGSFTKADGNREVLKVR